MITKVYQDPMKGTSRPCPVLSSQPSCIANPSIVSLSTLLAPSSDKSFTPATSNLSDVRPKTSSGPSPSSKLTLGTASGLGLTKYTVNSATVRPKTSSGPKRPINLTISTSAANQFERPKTSSGPTSTSKKPNLVISTASVNPTRHRYTLSQITTSSPIDPIDRLKSIAATSSISTPATTTTSHNLYPSYPPTSTDAGFHTLHSRTSSASSIRSAASLSSNSSASSTSSSSSSSSSSSTTSSVSSASSVLKPNSLTKEYLFHLKSDQIADQWAGMRMLSPDEEWEEWGRGLKGVLEPRIVGMDCGWTPIGEILGH